MRPGTVSGTVESQCCSLHPWWPRRVHRGGASRWPSGRWTPRGLSARQSAHRLDRADPSLERSCQVALPPGPRHPDTHRAQEWASVDPELARAPRVSLHDDPRATTLPAADVMDQRGERLDRRIQLRQASLQCAALRSEIFVTRRGPHRSLPPVGCQVPHADDDDHDHCDRNQTDGSAELEPEDRNRHKGHRLSSRVDPDLKGGLRRRAFQVSALDRRPRRLGNRHHLAGRALCPTDLGGREKQQ